MFRVRVPSIATREAVSMGRARLMTGLIELEIKDAFPVGSVSLTTAMA